MTSSSGNLPVARRATTALVAAVTVAAIAHATTVLAFFVAGGANTQSLSQVSDYFLVSVRVTYGKTQARGQLLLARTDPTRWPDIVWRKFE